MKKKLISGCGNGNNDACRLRKHCRRYRSCSGRNENNWGKDRSCRYRGRGWNWKRPTGEGKVYYLNFKLEQADDWVALRKAEDYTAETGVPVTVVTAASGTMNLL